MRIKWDSLYQISLCLEYTECPKDVGCSDDDDDS